MQNGRGVSRGIAVGKALVYESKKIELTKRMITVGQVDAEKQRILQAVEDTQRELEGLLAAQDPEEEVIRDLLEVQIEVAEDPEIITKANQYVEIALNEAGDALIRAAEDAARELEKLDSEYLQARAADIRDVGMRLASHAFGIKLVDLSSLDGPAVVFAEDITPSETVTLDRGNVLGFVTRMGSETSHTAILAKMLEIPAIVGAQIDTIRTGQIVAIDGSTGELIVEPTSAEIINFERRRALFLEDRERLQTLRDLPAVTEDGVRVELSINIASPQEAIRASEVGADGVGLFRTEFIYMDRTEPPTEDVQFGIYKAAVENSCGPVTFRTLDAGGDKDVPYLGVDVEDNPFLGYRAIRICLDQPALFKDQINALLRASAFGDLKIMFPMISSLSQLQRSLVLLQECKAELRARGIAFDPDVEIGIMVEVPAVAAAAELYAPHVQFFSIGTNDLCQYSLAVDRMNPRVADLFTHFSPGVLRLISHTIAAAKAHGVKVGMCGEMAGSLPAIPLLLGMGLEEFSMSPANIPYVKDRVRGLTSEKAELIRQHVMAMDSAIQIKEYLEGME